ncbi:MAG: carbamoyl-phosphate synthase small subunit [Acidobacteria bacterium]|nr:carbamoyl-phosphate synthase small subunit [Acidobacteriota bacterium]
MDEHRTAILALEDGRTFRGRSWGAAGEACGEMVFNTSMSGYQEVLTDPSYAGQIVCMTYPLIGNYGVNAADAESGRPWVEGFVVREASRTMSNWRAEETLDDYLKRWRIPAIDRVDTRALVRHIRDRGAMRACLSTTDADEKSVIGKAKNSTPMENRELASVVTTREPYGGIFLSNGPGDPAAMAEVVEEIRRVAESGIPTFGICFGHQLLGRAFGGTTYKLRFGHRGGNQPVRDEQTRAVEITSHNHGFAVEAASLPEEVEVTHVNLNDDCVEGMRHKRLPVFSVQYHPEAAPGPHDAAHHFRRFVELMGQARVA